MIFHIHRPGRKLRNLRNLGNIIPSLLISKFSVLPYSQNQKLGFENLGKKFPSFPSFRPGPYSYYFPDYKLSVSISRSHFWDLIFHSWKMHSKQSSVLFILLLCRAVNDFQHFLTWGFPLRYQLAHPFPSFQGFKIYSFIFLFILCT